MFMKPTLAIFSVFFFGYSFLMQCDSSKAVVNQNASTRIETSATPKQAENLLPTEAKVEKATLKLENCRLTFSTVNKTETFDFAFPGVCGFEKNPNDENAPRIVETPNGRVVNVIGVEKTSNDNPNDKHSQPCKTNMRWVIVKDGEIFLSAKTVTRTHSCVTQLDEKDYFIFSKNPLTLKEAENEKAESPAN